MSIDVAGRLHFGRRYNGSERWSVDGTTKIEHYIQIDTTTGKCPAEIASEVIEALTSRGLFPQRGAQFGCF